MTWPYDILRVKMIYSLSIQMAEASAGSA